MTSSLLNLKITAVYVLLYWSDSDTLSLLPNLPHHFHYYYYSFTLDFAIFSSSSFKYFPLFFSPYEREKS